MVSQQAKTLAARLSMYRNQSDVASALEEFIQESGYHHLDLQSAHNQQIRETADELSSFLINLENTVLKQKNALEKEMHEATMKLLETAVDSEARAAKTRKIAKDLSEKSREILMHKWDAVRVSAPLKAFLEAIVEDYEFNEYEYAFMRTAAVVGLSIERYKQWDSGGSLFQHQAIAAKIGLYLYERAQSPNPLYFGIAYLVVAGALFHDAGEARANGIIEFLEQSGSIDDEEDLHTERYVKEKRRKGLFKPEKIQTDKKETFLRDIFEVFEDTLKGALEYEAFIGKQSGIRFPSKDERDKDIGLLSDITWYLTRLKGGNYFDSTEAIIDAEKPVRELTYALRNLDNSTNNQTMTAYTPSRKLKNIIKATKVINEQRMYLTKRRQSRPTLEVMMATLDFNIVTNYEALKKEIKATEEALSEQIPDFQLYKQGMADLLNDYTQHGGFYKTGKEPREDLIEQRPELIFEGTIARLKELLPGQNELKTKQTQERIDSDAPLYYAHLLSLQRLYEHYMLDRTFYVKGL
ncbi:hypothetical protein C4573_05065 [Candidatus Woesearchaeota archaeon]|nr:MAG: hypothetical protein C4573_05065 [Candidatus Woesearchaeota archaeon]